MFPLLVLHLDVCHSLCRIINVFEITLEGYIHLLTALENMFSFSFLSVNVFVELWSLNFQNLATPHVNYVCNIWQSKNRPCWGINNLTMTKAQCWSGTCSFPGVMWLVRWIHLNPNMTYGHVTDLLRGDITKQCTESLDITHIAQRGQLQPRNTWIYFTAFSLNMHNGLATNTTTAAHIHEFNCA